MDPVIVLFQTLENMHAGLLKGYCRVIAGQCQAYQVYPAKIGWSTEPYFFAAAYQYVRDFPISVNDKGGCVIGKAVEDTNPDCDVIGNAGPPMVAHRV